MEGGVEDPHHFSGSGAFRKWRTCAEIPLPTPETQPGPQVFFFFLMVEARQEKCLGYCKDIYLG